MGQVSNALPGWGALFPGLGAWVHDEFPDVDGQMGWKSRAHGANGLTKVMNPLSLFMGSITMKNVDWSACFFAVNSPDEHQSADLGQSKDPDGAARVLKCLHLGSATAFHQPRSAYGKSAEFWGFQRTKTKPLTVSLLIDYIGYHRRLYYLIDWGVWQLLWQPNNDR